MEREEYHQLSGVILDASIAVHREMGPGLLEAVYHHCLMKELDLRGIGFKPSLVVALVYKGYKLNKEYIMDLLVEGEIVVELKAVEVILPVHEAQIISYLKLSNKKLGLLINFNVPLLKNGYRRFVNDF